MWRHYVYIHRRADDGLPFYVGKGTLRNNAKMVEYERAHSIKAPEHTVAQNSK